MDLASIKAKIQTDIAKKKEYFKSGTYDKQLQEYQDVYQQGMDQYTGILYAGTAPTAAQKAARHKPTGIPDDTLLTRAAKQLYNTVTPESMNVGVNYGGMTHYNTDRLGYDSNKEFNDLNANDLAKRIQDTPDDPNGAGTFYYIKVRDGYDQQGNPNWVYKAGTSGDSVFQRYLEELSPSNYQVIASKRTNDYQDLERLVHGNKTLMQQRSFMETGMHKNNGTVMPSGNSELYNQDILGLDSQSDAQLEQNRKADYQKFIANRERSTNSGLANWGSALGSGAVNLAGKGIKAVGELESTQTDNNFLTRAGKDFATNADKYANYNRRDQNLGGYKMSKGASKVLDGDVSGMFDMLDGIVTGGPEAFLNSAPEMVAQTAGGASPVGLLAKAGVLLANTNDQLDKRLENTGTRKDATWDEKAGVLASQSLVQAMDTAAFKFVMDGAKVAIIGPKTAKAIPLEEFLKGKSPTFIGAFAKGMSTAAKGGAGVAVEGAQEAAQEAINILQEQYGTAKYKDQSMGSILSSQENVNRLKDAASQGAIAGGSVSMAASTYEGGKETVRGITNALEDRNVQQNQRPGSVGDAELNAAALETIAQDNTAHYKALGDLHTNVSSILQSDISNVEKIAALDQATGSSERINAGVKQVKDAILTSAFTSLSPEMTAQLREEVRVNPELDQQVTEIEQQLTQMSDPETVSPDAISQQALQHVIGSLPITESTALLSTVTPDAINQALNTFDSKVAEKQLGDAITSQQNEYGKEISKSTRQARYQRENAPLSDDINEGIQKLSERSSRWSKKAESNVSDILSKMSDSALTEAVTKTGELAQATKRTRSLWQALKGQEKENGVLNPKQIAELITKEQNKRATSQASLLTSLHDKSWSTQATKAMTDIVKQIDAISKAAGIDSVSSKTGNTLIKSHPDVKNLFHTLGNFINNISSQEDMAFAQNTLKHLKLNGHLINERLLNHLDERLSKVSPEFNNSANSKTKVNLVNTLVTAKSNDMVQKLIDNGQLKTKHELAGVLRSNQFANLQQIGIVRKAIAAARKTGELTDALAASMNKRLDLFQKNVESQERSNEYSEVKKDTSDKLTDANEAVGSVLSVLRDFDKTITVNDVSSILKEAPQERLDKIVKMICG